MSHCYFGNLGRRVTALPDSKAAAYAAAAAAGAPLLGAWRRRHPLARCRFSHVHLQPAGDSAGERSSQTGGERRPR